LSDPEGVLEAAVVEYADRLSLTAMGHYSS
jgi:hypothetical protein